MCCFSGRVKHVDQTRIFARFATTGRQLLAYQLRLEADEAVAMVLPLPVARGATELRFLSLDGYRTFFDELELAWPQPQAKDVMLSASIPRPAALKVHEVGDFVASFVPSLRDFTRLDARFRMPAGTLDAVPQYADWGFAVFQLAATKRPEKMHPMAFEFASRDERLFFPTVHVHDGELRSEAKFAHVLYAQGVSAREGWWEGDALRLDERRAQGLIVAGARAVRRPLHGVLPNEDTWL